MTPSELHSKLAELMALPGETEWAEFKEAKSNHDFDDLGKYFCALSNEANLKAQPWAWLVFGVTNRLPRHVVGSSFRSNRPSLDGLKRELTQFTNTRITFEEIYELILPQGRVVMFQIPAALQGIPTSWKGHFYGRDGESLGPLSLTEIEQLRSQSVVSTSGHIFMCDPEISGGDGQVGDGGDAVFQGGSGGGSVFVMGGKITGGKGGAEGGRGGDVNIKGGDAT